jgi:molybdopterin/thiamine biosynthesis adenylyltransferase/rhodanese-related sulfurtransferase
MTEQENIRYNRQIILPSWGIEAQEKVKRSRVLVIGAGGLGCPVLSYLAAAGTGSIGIMDFDVVEVSNLQRQVLYDMNDLGKNKAMTALQKLNVFNPLVNITAIERGLEKSNALEIIAEYDLVVDATDNFETRYLINDACVILNKPFVFASILGFEGQVSVFNYKDGPTYRCLYPEPPEKENAPNCNENGVIGALAGAVGCIQANEVLKIISGAGEPLSGKLLIIDLLHNRFSTLQVAPVAANKEIKSLGDYNIVCNSDNVTFVSKKNFAEKFSQIPHMTIDVSDEYEFVPIENGAKNIPLYEIEDYVFENNTVPIVLYCKSGLRSKQAALILSKRGMRNIFCLTYN